MWGWMQCVHISSPIYLSTNLFIYSNIEDLEIGG